jgi:hypothetical protein
VTSAHGFSLAEVLLALCLTLVVTSAAIALVNPAATLSQTQPEAIDMQQRVRVAADALLRDLKMAGAGMNAGPRPGSLVASFAPVLPRRIGAQSPDPAASARADAITITYVPATFAQASTSAPVSAATGLTIDTLPNCPAGQTLCGFQAGMTTAVFGPTGQFDLFSLTSVQSTGAQWQIHGSGSGAVYPTGTPVSEVQSYTYYFDPARSQLRQYDGDQTDVPVADNVVGLAFEYFGDPQPPSEPRPPLGIDNCLYETDGRSKPLPVLTPQGALAPLPLSMLADGPWCGSGATQFDADLLRLRMVKVSLRVQTSSAVFRGSGPAFVRPGTARASTRYLPDAVATFVVAPRNLSTGR